MWNWFAVEKNTGTVVFQVMTYFFCELAREDIYAAMRTFKHKQDGVIFTPKEMDDYNK